MLRTEVLIRFSLVALYIALLASLFVVLPAGAQVIKIRTKPSETSVESLSLSVTPAIINFTLVPGRSAFGSNSANISIIWSGLSTSTTLTLQASFGSAALTAQHGSATIPASALYGQLSGSSSGGTYMPFTRSNLSDGAGASLKILSVPLSQEGASNRLGASLFLKIDLVSLPQLPPDTYTGTLTFQVQDM